jgi:hypothetical protein
LKKGKLNSEMTRKIWKKGKSNSEKIWKIWKKSKLNSEKIWKIQKKSKLNCAKIWKIQTDFVCLYNYEFWLSLCKIVRSSVILLLPLWYGQYGRKASWIVKRYEKYGRNPSWIVKRYGQ